MIDSNESMNFFEECWIIYGLKFQKQILGNMIYESEGGPGSVDFDWDKIFRLHRHIVGWVHTHPSGLLGPSSTDDRTMAGWVKAIGKPLLCGIKSGNLMKMYLYARETNGKKGSTVSYQEIPFLKMMNFLSVKVG